MTMEAERPPRPALDHRLTVPGAFVPVAVVGAFAMFSVPIVHTATTNLFPPAPTIPATVKIETAAGHGSGAHIGNGLILTAAHVVRDQDTATIKTEGDTRGAEVLWVSDTYDVALLTTAPANLRTLTLNCTTPAVGAAVTAFGNPLGMEFVRTSGQVVGPVGSALGIPGAYPVDMTILPGMSGGPVVDVNGQVVGISVAVMSYPVGFVPQLTGIGMVVSGEAICELLGRE